MASYRDNGDGDGGGFGGHEPADPPDVEWGTYKPRGRKGPATTLTDERVEAIAQALAQGWTKKDAAAAAGTTDTCLQNWLTRGRATVANGKRSIYTRLLVEVEAAEAHYRGQLIRNMHAAVSDKRINDKALRWRLATSSPKDFTVPRGEGAGPASNALGPAFEMQTPEAAMAALEEKLMRFLGEDDARAAFEASVADEPAAPAPDAPKDGPGDGD